MGEDCTEGLVEGFSAAFPEDFTSGFVEVVSFLTTDSDFLFVDVLSDGLFGVVFCGKTVLFVDFFEGVLGSASEPTLDSVVECCDET